MGLHDYLSSTLELTTLLDEILGGQTAVLEKIKCFEALPEDSVQRYLVLADIRQRHKKSGVHIQRAVKLLIENF